MLFVETIKYKSFINTIMLIRMSQAPRRGRVGGMKKGEKARFQGTPTKRFLAGPAGYDPPLKAAKTRKKHLKT
jgi:hypothetical protein